MGKMAVDKPSSNKVISPYDKGFTVHEASAVDPRFSYSLYIPESALEDGAKPKLIVSVHGTGRRFESALESLASFSRWNNCVVMCPLFPAGALGDRNLHGYKYLIEQDIRYDLVLLSMIDEVAQRYRWDLSKFMLCGFSGGGHFVHRFLLLHPERLAACSIGAPGSVTLIDPNKPWWLGTQNMQSLFGKTLDLEKLQMVPTHLAVGSVDIETWEITHRPGGQYFMEGANDAGATRPERLETLKRSFEAAGISCEMEVMSGAAHDERRYLSRVQDFFAQILQKSADRTA